MGSGSLPGVTRALMAVSAFFTKWWWLVLGVLALLVIAYLTFRRTERGRAALAAWSLTRAPLRRRLRWRQQRRCPAVLRHGRH